MSYKTYEDLIVWQKAHQFTLLTIKILRKIPYKNDTEIIKNQLIRSTTSIPANIAEGYGGYKSKKSFRNYLITAKRSAIESDYWLRLAFDINMINNDCYNLLKEKCRECIKILVSMIKKLE